MAVTAFAMREDRERAFESGFDGYVEKPISVRGLPAQVRGFLIGRPQWTMRRRSSSSTTSRRTSGCSTRC